MWKLERKTEGDMKVEEGLLGKGHSGEGSRGYQSMFYAYMEMSQ